MALADPYVDAETYKASVGRDSNEENEAIKRELVAVSRYIDRQLGRWLGFNKDEQDVERFYEQGSGLALDILDTVSVTEVALDSSRDGTYSTVIDDYELLPRNAATGPEPWPYTRIERDVAWVDPVRVTGIGGWPEVPDAIKAATIELTAILRIESPRATNRINEMGTVFSSTSRPAQDIVAGLMRVYANAAAVI